MKEATIKQNNHLQILKQRATLPAIYGTIVACCAVVLATVAAAYFTYDNVALSSVILAQKTNPALWLLDCMPFVFGVWGQFVSVIIAQEAGTMLIDQTHDLRSQTRQLQSQVDQHANVDILTQLPNRHALCESLTDIIKLDRGRISTIILIDIDDFKDINNTLGQKKGDFVLKQVGYRLKKAMGSSKTAIVARIGGDVFGILAADVSDRGKINKIIAELRANLAKPFLLDGLSVSVSASYGMSQHPKDGQAPEELLRHAEVAMQFCKRENRDSAFYSEDMDSSNLGHLVLKTEIHRALENNELCLHYQPKINNNDDVDEVEALVRWNHPEKGMIFPDQFIPIIEEKRLNKELLECILLLALQQAAIWKEKDIHLRIAINLTAFDLLDPALPSMIADLLVSFKLTADVLKLEITETTLVENQKLTLETLTKLSKMGIKTSIDDFGTGYSSLAYLSSLPVDEIKIDRAFVMDMLKNDRNNKIVQAIIALAHSLELHTVAEGIEDKETLNELKDMNCDYLQGYHISKPLNATDFDVWLTDWQDKL